MGESAVTEVSTYRSTGQPPYRTRTHLASRCSEKIGLLPEYRPTLEAHPRRRVLMGGSAVKSASAVTSAVHLLPGATRRVLSLLCQMQCHLHCICICIWSHYEHKHICGRFSFRGLWTTNPRHRVAHWDATGGTLARSEKSVGPLRLLRGE
jgi:hypothetical protein